MMRSKPPRQKHHHKSSARNVSARTAFCTFHHSLSNVATVAFQIVESGQSWRVSILDDEG